MNSLKALAVVPAVGLVEEIERCPIPALVAFGLGVAVSIGVMALVGDRLPEPRVKDDDDIDPRELVEGLIGAAVALGVVLPVWLPGMSWWGC